MHKTAFIKGYQNDLGIDDNTATVVLGFLAKQAGLSLPEEEVKAILDTPMDKTANEDIRKALFVEGYAMDKEAFAAPLIQLGLPAAALWGGSKIKDSVQSKIHDMTAPGGDSPEADGGDKPWHQQAWDWATQSPWHTAGVLGGGGALAYFLLKQKQEQDRARLAQAGMPVYY